MQDIITIYSQSLIKYSLKFGVTKAAIKYKVNRQCVYRWKKRYDGTLQSLADKPHRPHHHPNQHTPEILGKVKAVIIQAGYKLNYKHINAIYSI